MRVNASSLRALAARLPISGTRRLLSLVAVPAVVIAIGACQKASPPSRAADSAATVSATPPVIADPVPPPIAAVGHLAENAYDFVLAGDWTKSRAAADSLRNAVAAIDTAGLDHAILGQLRAENDALQRSVAAGSKSKALVQANALTASAARLAAPFGPRVPAEVTLLDHYGRELEIWSAAKNEKQLLATARAITATWKTLRPSVSARDSSEAVRFGDLVTRVENARTIPDYAALAKPVLDAVDLLEGVFTR